MASEVSSTLNSIFIPRTAGNRLYAGHIKSYQSFQDAAYAKISSLGRLLSSLEKLKDSLEGIKIDSLRIMTSETADEALLKSTAYSSAEEGIYNINILNAAESHALISKTYPDINSAVGTGTVTVKIADNLGTDIYITESRKTLTRIKDALDASDSGINAKLVKDAGGYRLMVSAKESGASNKINITVLDDDLDNSDSSGLSAIAYDIYGARNLEETTQPRNAAFFADNVFYDRASNESDDAVAGVKLELLKESRNYPVAVTVSEDFNSYIFEKLDAFIEAYNDAIKLIGEIGGRAGVLSGDSSIGHLKNRLEDIETTAYNGSQLKSLGFKLDYKGIMSLDIGKMNSAMLSDLAGAVEIVNSLAEELGGVVSDYIDSVVPQRQDDFRSLINAYAKAERETLKTSMTSIALSSGNKRTISISA